MRIPIIAANWKMFKRVEEAIAFVEALAPRVQDLEGTEIVIAAPFTALESLRGAVSGTPIALAGQNVHHEPEGAFTGEISAGMLADVGCSYGIVGHSERRALFGESSELVSLKLQALLACEIRPIVCVGETLEQREANRTLDVIRDQLDASLAGLPPERAEEIVLAYEPVWAIGTGKTATPEIAQEVHGAIRDPLKGRFPDAAARIRIQYGGSVKPANSYALMEQPDIDGALVGGASLDPASFYAIIRFDLSPEEAAQ
jgi:triosephosphate isomerase